MRTYDAVRDLPLRIEAVETERLALEVSSEFTRVTTIVRLRGDGQEGAGEDVAYDGAAHKWFPELPRGEHSLGSFSAAVAEIGLFRPAPRHPAFTDYRRWAIEAAALDLALRQAGTTLGEVVGREPQPVRFVVSTRAQDLEPVLGLYPSTRFKLDPTAEWTDGYVAALA